MSNFEKIDKNIEVYFFHDGPNVVYFIESGFPDKYIRIDEDPFEGPVCRLISSNSKKDFIDKWHKEFTLIKSKNEN